MTIPTLLKITGRNWVKESGVTLALGSWTLPIANILDTRPSIYAQASSNNPNTNTRFSVDLGVARKIDLIWFVYLRAGNTGTITIEIGNDATFVTNLYTITAETCWPQDNTVTDNWGNTTNGTFLALTYETINMPRFFPLSSTVTARYIRVTVSDTGNATPLRIGCFGASEVASFQFTYNWQMSFMDDSIETLAVSSTPYYEFRRRRRRLNITFTPMDDATLYGRFFDWLSWKGQTEPFVILPFGEADYETRLEKVGLYGRRSAIPSFMNMIPGYNSLSLQVDEL